MIRTLITVVWMIFIHTNNYGTHTHRHTKGNLTIDQTGRPHQWIPGLFYITDSFFCVAINYTTIDFPPQTISYPVVLITNRHRRLFDSKGWLTLPCRKDMKRFSHSGHLGLRKTPLHCPTIAKWDRIKRYICSRLTISTVQLMTVVSVCSISATS